MVAGIHPSARDENQVSRLFLASEREESCSSVLAYSGRLLGRICFFRGMPLFRFIALAVVADHNPASNEEGNQRDGRRADERSKQQRFANRKEHVPTLVEIATPMQFGQCRPAMG